MVQSKLTVAQQRMLKRLNDGYISVVETKVHAKQRAMLEDLARMGLCKLRKDAWSLTKAGRAYLVDDIDCLKMHDLDLEMPSMSKQNALASFESEIGLGGADLQDDDVEGDPNVPPEPDAVAVPDELREQILQVLRDSLRIEVESAHWTDPNTRDIKVMLGDDVVASASFCVKDKAEYEG